MYLENNMSRKTQFMSYLASLVLFDLLFLPYFQVVVIPISLPLVFAFIFLDKNFRIPSNHLFYFSIVAIFVVLSAYFSLFLNSSDYLIENLKRSVQFLTSFVYFSFFYYLASNANGGVVSKKVILAFLVFFSSLSVAFYVDPLFINSLLKSIYGKTVTSEEVVSIHRRYAYIFSDPNTAAYFLLIACVPLFYTTKNIFLLIFVFLMISLSLIMTQSRGGILVLLLCSAIGLMTVVSNSSSFKKTVLSIVIVFLFFSLLAFYYFILSRSPDFDAYFNIFSGFRRLSEYEAYSGSSRLEIWRNLVTSLEPFPVGRGYFLSVDGEIIKPHSDALRLVYSYGIVVFVLILSLFILLLFRYPLFVIPAFVAFSINTLIDEQKAFALFLCWAGALYGANELGDKGKRLASGDKIFK